MTMETPWRHHGDCSSVAGRRQEAGVCRGAEGVKRMVPSKNSGEYW